MNLDELRSVQAKERRKDSLQHLRDTFYEDVASYIADLRAARDRRAEQVSNPFSDDDVRRMSDEVETAEEVAEALYERRVGKVVKLASFAAADMPVEREGMTTQERELFEDLVARIETNKSSVLDVLTGAESAEAAETTLSESGTAVDSESGTAVDSESGTAVDSGAMADQGESAGETPSSAGQDAADTAAPIDVAETAGASANDSTTSDPGSPSTTRSDPGTSQDDRDRQTPPDESGPDPAARNSKATTSDRETPATNPAELANDDPTELANDDPTGLTSDPQKRSNGQADAAPTPDRDDPDAGGALAEAMGANADSSTRDTDDGSTTPSVSDGGSTLDRTVVRITRDVGEILGVDEREYDLEQEDVVTLPAANADPLLERDAAERIE